MNDSQTGVGKMAAVSKTSKTEAAAEAGTGGTLRSPAELHQTISVVAYYLAERRSFEPGHEMEDWLNAEAQVLAETQGLRGFPA